MAGRAKSLTLYKTKTSPNWRFHLPGHGIFDTETSDKHTAQMVLDKARREGPAPKRQQPDMQVISGGDPVDVNPLRAAINSIAADAGGPVESERKPAFTPDVAAPSDSEAEQSVPQHQETVSHKPSLAERLKVKDKEKVINVLAKSASRANALAVEIGYSFTGRKLKEDVIITDEDLEILKIGFEMGASELFENLDPKWWHVVLAGNLLLAAQMYPNTEAKPKAKLTPAEDTDSGTENGSGRA